MVALQDRREQLRARLLSLAVEPDTDWLCEICGYRGPEQRSHRMGAAGSLYDCPAKRWRQVPVEAPKSAELVDRPVASVRGMSASAARLRAAEAVRAMRVGLRVLRGHWRDVLRHEGLTIAVPARAEEHHASAERARADAAAQLELIRQGRVEVEELLRHATLADQATAARTWNRATSAERARMLRERRPAKSTEGVVVALQEHARDLAALAEAEPTQWMHDEVRICLRNATGLGERPDRWIQSAARENERRERSAPLLYHTGVLAKASPEEREARMRAACAADDGEEDRRREEKWDAQADEHRALVRGVVDDDEVAELDARRGKLPLDGVYGASFWHDEARKRGLLPDPAWLVEVRAIEARRRERAARLGALDGEQTRMDS